MKNTIKTTAQLILAATLIFTACKKKEDNTSSEPAPTPTPVTSVNPLTASISGNSFTTALLYNNGTKDIYRIYFNKNSNALYLTAYKNKNSNDAEAIQLNIPYSVGTYTLNQQNSNAGYYGYYSAAKDTISFWTATSSTINVTQIDTSGTGFSVINKLKATFTFSTTLNKGLTYNITNGVIDYTK